VSARQRTAGELDDHFVERLTQLDLGDDGAPHVAREGHDREPG
jgi:hypothetical protein